MSLSFSSPRSPTKRGRFAQTTRTPIQDSGDNDNSDEDTFHTPAETAPSPLPNTTILGQFNRMGSLNQRNGETVGSNRSELPPPSEEPMLQESVMTEQNPKLQFQHLYVLPVLLLEFLAIALTRAVLPSILIEEYGSNVYVVLGIADCIRGILAFFACPLFGKLSDALGRKLCLFVTVLGSCAPVCSLAFFQWEYEALSYSMTFPNGTVTTESHVSTEALPPLAIPLFVALLSISGLFSSTFPLVFAYISDSVQERTERVTAYGLALATFGLSFTIGPMAGGYLASVKTDYVFQSSLVLTLLDLLYIYAVLPESITPRVSLFSSKGHSDNASTSSVATSKMLAQIADSISWDPLESIRLVLHDPFLRKVGQVAFFYYTGLWAVISTLSLYAVQHFGMNRQRLGELMSALGLSTMVAEAVLVRFLVPLLGEKKAIKIGLISFALQCFVLGAANEPWHLFVCAPLSMLGNLVYPSLSSLVSGIVEPEIVGEALGAINGIKALTEGIGPLIFGSLMTVSEHTAFPGSPYWLAGVFVFVAHHLADKLPANSDPELYPFSPPSKSRAASEKEYIHELEFKRRYPSRKKRDDEEDDGDCLSSMYPTQIRDEEDEEYQALLSEVEESPDEWEAINAAEEMRRDDDNDLGFAQKPVPS